MFLLLQDVSKVFNGRDGGETTAVNQVNLTIERSQFVTLLGPSGCGKTTTLRLVAGFEFPTHGQIVLDGQVINETPPNQRDMAMVFQSYALFPHLTVFENIAYGLRIRKLSEAALKTQVGQALALTELTGLEQRAPSQLSGGQQQRVALARALVMQPKVLLFDEPLSNLDAKLRVQMRSEIRRIQQTLGITSLYVTHDQEEAMVLSDQIVVMHQGRIQQVGTPVEIYRRPANRFVADFIGRANFLPVTVSGQQTGGWQVRLFDQTLRVPGTNTPLAAGQRALLLVRPESLRVHPTPHASGATLPATIRRTAYLGAQIEYELDMAGQSVLVVQADPGEQALYPAGTTVHLDVLAENAYLLPGGE